MNANETGAGDSSAIQSAYEKWENFYGLVVGLSGFACIGLIFMNSAYFAVFVVVAAAAGLARYIVRKKIRDLANAAPSYSPWRKMGAKFKYPEKPGPQSPFHDLLRKLGH